MVFGCFGELFCVGVCVREVWGRFEKSGVYDLFCQLFQRFCRGRNLMQKTSNTISKPMSPIASPG